MQENYCGLVNNGYSSRSNYKHAACIIASWSLAVLFTFSNQNLNPSILIVIKKQTHFQKRNQMFHLLISHFSHITKVRSNSYKSLKDQCQKLSFVIDKLHFWKTNQISFLYHFFSQASKYVPSPTKAWKIANRNLALCNRRSKMPTYKFNKPDSHLRFLGVKKLPSLQVTWPLLEKCPKMLHKIICLQKCYLLRDYV